MVNYINRQKRSGQNCQLKKTHSPAITDFSVRFSFSYIAFKVSVFVPFSIIAERVRTTTTAATESGNMEAIIETWRPYSKL